MNLGWLFRFAVISLLFALPQNVSAEVFDAEGLRLFETKIRPALIEHCYECHSAEAKSLYAGLRLDSRTGLLQGGDSGPAIVPGQPGESLILSTLRYDGSSYEMPPKGKLPDDVIEHFEKWIQLGAPDPRTDEPPQIRKPATLSEAKEALWSLQVPVAKPAPDVGETDWPRVKLDWFILQKLQDAGLDPSEVADKRTLIRRVYFDLTGLSPTFSEVEEFVNDQDADAYHRLVERLLASPHYGERWGRHWLDVVRYAEDNVNMGPHNGPYANAYRYRDWVIAAVNADLPYDDFIRFQLAADFQPDATPEDLAALGMLGLSPQYHKELLLSVDALDSIHADEWEDRIDVVTRGLMGLTVACARCHDHKYDPVTTKDYYALAGVFASLQQTTRPMISADLVAASQPARDEVERLRSEIKTLDEKIAGLKSQAITAEFTESMRDEQVAASTTAIAEHQREIERIQTTTPHFDFPVVDAIKEVQVRFEPESESQQKFVFYEKSPRDLPVFIRGSVTAKGEIVPRRFLEVLTDGEIRHFQQGSGRYELAEEIVSAKNPLTARVFVNRVWQRYFGTGIVETPSNFGAMGALPSHPELLDTLAADFMENGWSLKWLHRQIVHSATYRQSSKASSEIGELKDPANRLKWRFERRRHDAETLHDALLQASESLNLKAGGPSGNIDDPTFDRRSVYAKVSRDRPSLYLQIYDFPDPTIHAEQRSLTTSPLQQLYLLNSPFVSGQAERIANQITHDSVEDQITELHRRVFGRDPSEAELKSGVQFLNSVNLKTPLQVEFELPKFAGQRMSSVIPEIGEAYSVSIWFKNTLPLSARPITTYLFSRAELDDPEIDGDHLGIGGTHDPESTGRLFLFNGNRMKSSLVGKTVLVPDQWNYVTLVRQGNQATVYLNGNPEPEIQGELLAVYGRGAGQFFVGARSDFFAPFEGSFGTISLFDRELNTQEISVEGILEVHQQPDHEVILKRALSLNPHALWPLFSRPSANGAVEDATGNQRQGLMSGTVQGGARGLTPWQLYCHAMLCSNEFLYVD
ncbi:DUF1553 domain-containing protein [Planctomicrobium sp. SH668]|uniref:DUF1553 domain-containing protein n=1 Tax=Planctomicrobium sp. SH668 TaxID=3448126 RepID=UPI003F5B51FA